MWRQFYELARRIVTLTQDTTKNSDDIRELQGQVRELRDQLDRITAAVQHLAY